MSRLFEIPVIRCPTCDQCLDLHYDFEGLEPVSYKVDLEEAEVDVTYDVVCPECETAMEVTLTASMSTNATKYTNGRGKAGETAWEPLV